MKLVNLPCWMLLLSVVMAQQPITDQRLFFGGTNTTANNSAYLTWLNDHGSLYDDAMFVPVPTTTESGAAIHWRISNNRIYLAVAARANGWLGFGIAEAGGMKGADIVYYTASTNQLVDAYVLDIFENGPLADNCQDWTLRNATSLGGFLIFEAVRDLKTGDTQDRPIINDENSGNVPAHRIIAAWGDSDQISYHGLTNRVRTSIRFYGQPDDTALFYETMKEQADGYFELRAVNYTIKQQDTEYQNFCFSRDALVALGAPANESIHVIGWEPTVSNDSTPFVHHFILYGSPDAYEGVPYLGALCQNSLIYQVGYVWAPGESPFALPDNVGAPYMDASGFQSLSLEIHYNNPTLVPSIVDNSGVRLYYITKRRDNDMFVFQFGDPQVGLRGTLVGGTTDSVSTSQRLSSMGSHASRVYQHTFDCPTSCTSMMLPQPVTVVREYLHMHKTGVRINNHQIRDGSIIRTGYVDFWDFAQQGNEAVVQQPFQVLPGDTFQTRCYYEPSNTTVFGLSSHDEMCISYLFFYRPRSSGPLVINFCGYNFAFEACAENHTKEALSLTSDLDRVFGAPTNNCTVVNNSTLETPGSVKNQTGYASSGAIGKSFLSCISLMTVVAVVISNFNSE